MTTEVRVAILAGGVLGTLLRLGVNEVLPVAQVPWATLVANLLGAFLLGRLAGELADAEPRVQAFAQIGLLGSFTTFSAVVVELVALGDRPLSVLLYGVLTVGGGLAAARLGLGMAPVPEVAP